MKNTVSLGNVLNYIVPSGGVTSGDLVLAGSLVGVAAVDGVEDETVSVSIKGCYEVKKVTGNAWTQGQAIYHNGTDAATGTVGSNKLAGYAAEAAASGDALGKLILK